MNELEQTRRTLFEAMNLLTALSEGIEQFVGPASKGMTITDANSLKIPNDTEIAKNYLNRP